MKNSSQIPSHSLSDDLVRFISWLDEVGGGAIAQITTQLTKLFDYVYMFIFKPSYLTPPELALRFLMLSICVGITLIGIRAMRSYLEHRN